MPIKRRMLAALLLMAPSLLWASDDERKLEAVFLGRFASYIEWPGTPRSEFVVTLIDENPFGTLLHQLYSDKTIHGRPVRVRHVLRVEDIGSTDILFVELQRPSARAAVIQYAQAHGILSISNAKGFADLGGIVQLDFVEQKVRIKINHSAAVRSGLKIGAPLLNIATLVKGDQP